MDLVSPRPFWPVRDGLPATFPPLEGNARCDVAVVGGGISGALVAWELVQQGIDVLVVDRREVAHGSTSGSTSLLQYELDAPLHRLVRDLGRARAQACYLRCRDAVAEIEALVRKLKLDCGCSHRSSLLLAANDSHVPRLRREFAAREEAGLAVEWWPRRTLAANSSLPHPAGILSRDAAQVDAYRLTYGLLLAATQAGAHVHARTAVTQIQHDRRGVQLRTSRGGTVRAGHLVIATGFEAEALLHERLTALHSTYALISEPVADFSGWPADRCLIWETARPYLYLRTTGDGRAIIGGYDEPFRDPVARDRLLAAKTVALRRRFTQLFPRIPLEVAASWAGTFADTPDGLPYIGHDPRRERVWLALGYGGNGITFSAIAAKVIADGIRGRKNRDGELFSFGRRRPT